MNREVPWQHLFWLMLLNWLVMFILFCLAMGRAHGQEPQPWRPSPAESCADGSCSTEQQQTAPQIIDKSASPAVPRICVKLAGGKKQYGTGVLISKDSKTGCVVTNSHVVADRRGAIYLIYPSGFTTPARLLKTDVTWQLAALQGYAPKAEPIRLAKIPPKVGERIRVAGYGKSGRYRVVNGPVIHYVSPTRTPIVPDMLEIRAPARRGDSGGPLVNDRGELVGILWGGTVRSTSGVWAGRIRLFLADVLRTEKVNAKFFGRDCCPVCPQCGQRHPPNRGGQGMGGKDPVCPDCGKRHPRPRGRQGIDWAPIFGEGQGITQPATGPEQPLGLTPNPPGEFEPITGDPRPLVPVTPPTDPPTIPWWDTSEAHQRAQIAIGENARNHVILSKECQKAVAELRQQMANLESQQTEHLAMIDRLTQQVAAMPEAGIVGPPGPAGKDGRDGKPGRNGIDGKEVDPAIIRALNLRLQALEKQAQSSVRYFDIVPKGE